MITPDMTVREVAEKYPDTVNVFGNYRIDFC